MFHYPHFLDCAMAMLAIRVNLTQRSTEQFSYTIFFTSVLSLLLIRPLNSRHFRDLTVTYILDVTATPRISLVVIILRCPDLAVLLTFVPLFIAETTLEQSTFCDFFPSYISLTLLPRKGPADSFPDLDAS